MADDTSQNPQDNSQDDSDEELEALKARLASANPNYGSSPTPFNASVWPNADEHDADMKAAMAAGLVSPNGQSAPQNAQGQVSGGGLQALLSGGVLKGVQGLQPEGSPMPPQGVQEGVASGDTAGLLNQLRGLSDSPSAQGTAVAPPPSGPSVGAQAGAPQQPSVRDYLMQKYGLGQGLDDKALQAAQAQAAQARQAATLGDAGDTFGAALSRGALKPDTAFWQGQMKNAQIPVENLLQRRAGMMQSLQNEATVNKLATEEGAADPNSRVSQSGRQVYGAIMQKFGMSPQLISGMSMEDIKSFMDKPIDTFSKLNEQLMQHQAQMQMAQMYKTMGFNQHAQDKLNSDKQFTDAVTAEAGAQNSLQQLEAARTNPAAYALLPIEIVRGIVKNRVSNQEIQAATGGQDFDSYLQRIVKKKADGTITDRDYDGFRQMLQISLTRAQQEQAAAVQRHSGQLSQLTGIDQGQAAQKITGGSAPQQQPGNKPQTVIQNGHTYTLNPQTGQYE